MCGLVGVAGRIEKIDNEVFRDLLQVDVIRGPHSTGIASSNIHQGARIFKKAVLPSDLLTMKGCDALFNDYSLNNILMGHNRWATVGKINTVNAHPFELKDIIGAHNGTLKNKYALVDHAKFDVDSEALFHSFEKIGVTETIAKVDGAYALTWFDKGGKVMNFLRNDQRPLWYCFSEDSETIYWASEAWMLRGVLNRNGVKHHEIMEFEKNYHYTLELPQNGNDKFGKFNMRPAPPYVPPVNNVVMYNGGGTSKDDFKNRNYYGRGWDNTAKKSIENGEERANPIEYKIGEDIIFRIPAYIKQEETNYVEGIVVFRPTVRVRVYLPKGSKLRSQMLEDPQAYFIGKVNGYYGDLTYVIQGNSVEPYEEEEDEEENDEVNKALFLQNVEKMECSWCSSPLVKGKSNLIVNSTQAFCQDCKDLDDVRQFLPASLRHDH